MINKLKHMFENSFLKMNFFFVNKGKGILIYYCLILDTIFFYLYIIFIFMIYIFNILFIVILFIIK